MCTVALAFQTHPRWPILVAANRDAPAARPSETWALRSPGDAPPFAAPRDLVGGGTWIGVSATSLFAAVSNFFVPGTSARPGRRSRGELVPLALRHGDAGAALRALRDGDPAAYNPFNLVVADPARAWLWSFDGEEARTLELGPGLHVVTNRAPDHPVPRSEIARGRWPADGSVAGLRAVLTVHGPGRQATCFHEDARGTCSAAVLRLGARLAGSELHVAEGRPCATPLQDRSELLARLGEAPSRRGATG